MIMQNPQKSDEKRIFTRILKTAGPIWNRFQDDRSATTAKGLYFATDDTSHIVDLSYNDDVNRLYLELRLKPANNPETVCSRLINFQDRWASLLASVTYIREDHLIRVQAKTVLEPEHKPGIAVKAIFEDLKRVVNDPCFQQILC